MGKETEKAAELTRLEEARTAKAPWKKWGPYLSERQWGTVREDYSKDGNAWDYFSHDQARSRAYRWGEDGLAGFCDDKQLLCFSLALWNGKDPILKERLFGLTNSEGNHGEDVKEYYFYLDSTPTHSYMKYLYKYPQAAYPYANLVDTNKTSRPHRHGIRTARHRCLRRRPLLGCVCRVCQGVARRRPDPDHRVQSRTGGSYAARAARRCCFAIPGAGAVLRTKPVMRAGCAAKKEASLCRRRMRSSVNVTCIARAMLRCCSPKTKRTTTASSASRTPVRT